MYSFWQRRDETNYSGSICNAMRQQFALPILMCRDDDAMILVEFVDIGFFFKYLSFSIFSVLSAILSLYFGQWSSFAFLVLPVKWGNIWRFPQKSKIPINEKQILNHPPCLDTRKVFRASRLSSQPLVELHFMFLSSFPSRISDNKNFCISKDEDDITRRSQPPPSPLHSAVPRIIQNIQLPEV